jgi:hypothetical protein
MSKQITGYFYHPQKKKIVVPPYEELEAQLKDADKPMTAEEIAQAIIDLYGE